MSVDINNSYNNRSWKDKDRLNDLCNDILILNRISNYNILIRAAASRYQNQFHFLFGGEKGFEINEVKNPTVNSISEFNKFYLSIKEKLEEREYKVGTHDFFDNTSKKLMHQWIYDITKVNTITIFVSIDVLTVKIGDKTYLENIKLIADELNKHFS